MNEPRKLKGWVEEQDAAAKRKAEQLPAHRPPAKRPKGASDAPRKG